MRSNPFTFALSLGMGLIVLLIGFLALNAAGSVGLPNEEVAVEQPILRDTTVQTMAQVPATAEESAGAALFRNNCAQCHAVYYKMVGPALSGITRRRTISWVIKWVKNSSKIIASDDEYAVKLFAEYGKQQMPAFLQLLGKDVENIVAWINSLDKKVGTNDDSSLAEADNTTAN